MKVTAKIQSKVSDEPPVDMPWMSNGTALDAVATVAQVLTHIEDPYTRVLSITVEV